MDRRWVLGSEELETLLHVLGDAAALPGRMAPDVRVDDDVVTAVRRTAAHSLRARDLVSPQGVEPTLAAALAVPLMQVIAYEIELERGGVVVSGAAAADATSALAVRPAPDGTVLLLATVAHELASAVVEAVRPVTGRRVGSPLDGELLFDPAVLDGVPADEPERLVAVLAERGADPRLAPILARRTGSAVVRAVVPPSMVGSAGPDLAGPGGLDGLGASGAGPGVDGAGDGIGPGARGPGEWRESGVPVSWWETDGGRVLVGGAPGPLARLVPGDDESLLAALAELAASVSGSLLATAAHGREDRGGTP